MSDATAGELLERGARSLPRAVASLAVTAGAAVVITANAGHTRGSVLLGVAAAAVVARYVGTGVYLALQVMVLRRAGVRPITVRLGSGPGHGWQSGGTLWSVRTVWTNGRFYMIVRDNFDRLARKRALLYGPLGSTLLGLVLVVGSAWSIYFLVAGGVIALVGISNLLPAVLGGEATDGARLRGAKE
jgi:hypothetical protein